jgi:hypothetical protein
MSRPLTAQPHERPHRFGIMRRMWTAALVIALAYGAIVALLWWHQERLIFLPVKLAPEHRFELGPDVHETWVDVPGARLHALHLKRSDPAGLVFYLHGNAGNLQSWFVNPDFWRAQNFDLFMLDYRGYGKSGGRIESQAQLEADVRAAWEAVAPRYAGRKRVVFGRSLGSGLAAALSAQVRPDLTVLVSAYESMERMAAEQYPWVPSAVLRYPLRTGEALAQVRNPVLLVHGARDELIPLHHSERLRQRAPGSQVLVIPQAGHNDLQEFPQYYEGLAAQLR